METIVKETRAVGTSAGVLLPRSWMNKKVVVTLEEKNMESITNDVLDILVRDNLLSNVKGIYLIGSYARGESTYDSDVDLLIITKDINKIINYLDYELTLISENNFSNNLGSNIYGLVAIREAKVILNSELLEELKKVKINLKGSKVVHEIKSVIKINESALEDVNLNVPDRVIYSLVLRMREAYYTLCLLKGKQISKNNLLKYISSNTYSAYKRVKENKKEIDDVTLVEARKLINLTKKWLKEIKG